MEVGGNDDCDPSAVRMAARAGRTCVVVFTVCCGALLASGLVRLFSGTHALDALSIAIALLSPVIILIAVALSIFRREG